MTYLSDFDHGEMRILSWSDPVEPVHLTVVSKAGSYAYEEHGHRGYSELIFVRRGTLQQRINGLEVQQGPGAVTLLRENDVHELAGMNCEFVNLAIDQRLAGPFLALLALPEERSAARPCWHGQLEDDERMAMELSIRAIRSSGDRPTLIAGWMAAAGMALRAILAPRSQPDSEWLMRALERLAASRGPVDLATFRRWCGVTDEHLARRVRRQCGMPPRALLTQHQVRLAANALLASDIPVAEIARRTGFSTPNLLHRHFHRHYGVSPTRWRRDRFV